MADLQESTRIEQEAYAGWLANGTRIGFVVLVATYFVYVSGLVPTEVPLERLPDLWGLPLDQYLAATDTPTGWRWLARIDMGDLMNLAGVAILAACTLACYLRVLPMFARRGEWAFVAVCLAEEVVLLAAASGIF
ncbi:MAG TPA: hypothetical protein VN782_16200 [Usitatibacter sp.]|nr:hypothetical protein [Usitatibacter sp.]